MKFLLFSLFKPLLWTVRPFSFHVKKNATDSLGKKKVESQNCPCDIPALSDDLSACYTWLLNHT